MDSSQPQVVLQTHLEGLLRHLYIGDPLITLFSPRFDLNRLVVNVEVENKCQLTNTSAAVEMRVSQISCISRKWTLEKLDREQGLLCLLPSESGIVHLKGSRLECQSSEGLVYSDVPLGPTLVSVSSPLRVLLYAMLSCLFQIPSRSFPVKEIFNGSAAFSSLSVPGGEGWRDGSKGSRNSEEIALMVFWQVWIYYMLVR
jgi:hypothetical protein